MIKSHRITEQTTQADGAKRTNVAFKDHTGKEHNRGFDFPPKTDIEKAIVARYSQIEFGLRQRDIEQAASKIIEGKAFTLTHATSAELKERLMEIEADKQAEIDRITIEKVNVHTEIIK